MTTFPELLARGLGVAVRHGDHLCFWCGASCDDSNAVAVSDTFWDWDAVAHPRSKCQCDGCSQALDEKRVIAGYDKPQKTRNHSWFASSLPFARSYTKADIATMRDVCLNPPQQSAWGLAIAESGQKHVIFRTPVNQAGSDAYAVQLELTTVRYAVDELAERLHLAATLASAIGKPPLAGALNTGHAIRLLESGCEPDLIDQWNSAWNSPLSRLAAFLCPGKDDCLAYLGETDTPEVPPATGRTGRREGQRSLFA